jgi:hypothetical protein
LSDLTDEKYIVFKRDEFNKCMMALLLEVDTSIVNDINSRQVSDAVVIRRQDVFAPPALDAYANSIAVAVKLAREFGGGHNSLMLDDLEAAADYFHEQAVASWETDRKVPD